MSDIRAVKRNISMHHLAAIIADRNTTDFTVKEYCTRNNLSRNSYFYWLRQLRQEATDSVDLKSLTKNTVPQEENRIVKLVPLGKKEMVAPIFIQEDETAGKSEGDSLRISIGDIDIYAGSDTSEELFAKVIRAIRHVYLYSRKDDEVVYDNYYSD